MKTERSREQDLRRRDIGSGVYVELLNREFLSLFFNNPGVRAMVLLKWGADVSAQARITWDEDAGIATYGVSDNFRVLVVTPQGAESIRKFIKKHGGFSSLQDKVNSNELRKSMERSIAEKLSKYTILARVIGYDATSSRKGKAKFIEDHISKPGEKYPKRRLISDTTVDTGRVVGFAVRSMPTMAANPNVVASSPAMTTMNRLHAARSSRNSSGRFALSRSTLAEFNAGQDPENQNSAVVVNAFSNEVDRTDEFTHTTQDGRFHVYQPSQLETPPVLSVGGGQNSMRSTATSYQWQNRNHVYMQEGTVNNPAAALPSSFFFPTPTVKTSLLSPLNVLAENPQYMLGLLAVGLLSSKNSTNTTFSQTYNNLPTVVQDNQEIENALFGGA